MLIELKNGHLCTGISTAGAELKSIKKDDVTDNVEYLWQLNPRIWERQAPLLFPLIGRLKDGEYVYGGKTYKTDIHGFARYKEFRIAELKSDLVVLEITQDEETLVEYPFNFRLSISYRLSENTIIKEHCIENMGKSEMLYEIGGHEGYNLALFDGESMEDYYIEFPGMDHLMTFRGDSDVMIGKDRIRVDLEKGRLYLSPEVFKNDALIMDNFKERFVRLCNTKNNREVVIEFNDFKYLGVWTKYMRGNYICLEPWTSLPDCNFIGKRLEEKIDIRRLESGHKEILKYRITIV